MKRIFRSSLLVVVLGSACCQTPVKAQFWKRIFHKEEQTHKPMARPKPAKQGDAGKKNSQKNRKSVPDEIVYPASRMKVRYRVDVLVPLYLNELVKNGKAVYKDRIPEKALPGMNFYEGVRLATDSLDKFGYSMDVYVHDIMDPLHSVETLISTKALDSSDLIIGAVPAINIPVLAQYAKKHTINFISTMSPSDGNVKDNPYFTLLQPTLATHCDWLRNMMVKKYRKEPVIVYHRSAVAIDETAFKNIVRDSLFSFRQVNANVLPATEVLRRLFDSTEKNVIVMPVLDVAYANQLLQQLKAQFRGYRFEVYGMPSWKGLAALKKTDALPGIGINFTAPFYFDASTASGQSVAQSYKKVYGGKPGEMVYRGYESIYWYSDLLNKYGPIFNKKVADDASATYTRFEIRPRWDKNLNLLYNENIHLYLYRYQDGSFEVE